MTTAVLWMTERLEEAESCCTDTGPCLSRNTTLGLDLLQLLIECGQRAGKTLLYCGCSVCLKCSAQLSADTNVVLLFASDWIMELTCFLLFTVFSNQEEDHVLISSSLMSPAGDPPTITDQYALKYELIIIIVLLYLCVNKQTDKKQYDVNECTEQQH